MTQSALEASLAWYEALRSIGESILVAGLICEILVVAFLYGSGRAEKRALLFSVLVIIIGVGTENIAGSRADLIVREIRAPRALSAEQQEAVAEKIRPYAGTHFDLSMHQDIEPMRLLENIEGALVGGGWVEQAVAPEFPTFNRGDNLMPVGVRTMVGIWIMHQQSDAALTVAAKQLVTALRDENVLATETIETGDAAFDRGVIHVWVGVKP
jgi:hypothetical protein